MPKRKNKGKKKISPPSGGSQQRTHTSQQRETEDEEVVQEPSSTASNICISDQSTDDLISTAAEDMSSMNLKQADETSEYETDDKCGSKVIEFTVERTAPEFAKKQAPGRLGKSVTLKTNLYPINLIPDGNVYHYDVEIIDCKRSKDSELSMLSVDKKVKKVAKYRCLSTKINRKVIEKLLETDINLKNSYAVFDGRKNLYTPKLLKLVFPYEKKVNFDDDPGPKSNLDTERQKIVDVFKVIIKPVKKKDNKNSCAINFEPLHELYGGRKNNVEEVQEIIQALETIFRHTPALKFTPLGRSFFHPSIGNIRPIGEGVEIWFGYHQSSRLGQWKPLINLNTSATTFFQKQPLIEYFAIACKTTMDGLHYISSVNNDILRKLNGDLKNVKILTTHVGKRKYAIEKIVNKGASMIELDGDSKMKSTISKYFLERYKIKLKYPNLPCVQVKPLSKNRFLPLELCEIIEGQNYRSELSARQKQEMIKYTCQSPRDKFQNIKQINENFAKYEGDKYLKQFRITVENQPLQVTGRVREAPKVTYSSCQFQPENGTWNIRGYKFLQGSVIKSWWLLNLAGENKCRRTDLENFARELKKIGNAAGMKFENAGKIESINEDNLTIKVNKLSAVFKEAKNRKVELLVVAIPDKNKYLYNNVKQIAEANNLGLMTQCIDHNNVKKCNPSLLSNVCQKINTKLGGINHKIAAEEIPKVMAQPIILMGADVSHASVTDKSGISVAAVTGSLDLTLSRFAATYKLQKGSKKAVETIQELNLMVKSLLLEFYRHTRQKPVKIIFFRDGVSEGQFPIVKEKELSLIRSACTELQADYKPCITFVVVQKRHQVRFMPADIRDGVGPERNMKPGTVIDTDVVHPLNRDFYLCSHYGLKGTSKPCHYTVLEDDSNFTPDEFQGLCNYLCYNFARCTKSISNPVPVRYADLVAYRIRLKLPKLDDIQAEKEEIPSEVLKAVEIDDTLKPKMYFV